MWGAGGPLPAALDTSTLFVAAQRGSTRTYRYILRRRLKEITGHKRVRVCGHALAKHRPKMGDGDAAEPPGPREVQIRLNDSGTAHYAGLLRCGMGHLCPVCAPKIADERAKEVERALAYWVAHGGGGTFTTLTLPHGAPDKLRSTLRVCLDGFRAMLQSREFRSLRKRLGIAGFIRRAEVTHGGNGWHPHLHIITFTDKPPTEAAANELHAYLFNAWQRYVVGAGLRTPRPECSKTQLFADDSANLAHYLTKLGKEFSRWDMKEGRQGGRSPFEILEDWANKGKARDKYLWLEYERAVYRTRLLTWTRGLKAACGMADIPDSAIVERIEAGRTVATVPREAWERIRKDIGLVNVLLEMAEAGEFQLLEDTISSFLPGRGGG